MPTDHDAQRPFNIPRAGSSGIVDAVLDEAQARTLIANAIATLGSAGVAPALYAQGWVIADRRAVTASGAGDGDGGRFAFAIGSLVGAASAELITSASARLHDALDLYWEAVERTNAYYPGGPPVRP